MLARNCLQIERNVKNSGLLKVEAPRKELGWGKRLRTTTLKNCSNKTNVSSFLTDFFRLCLPRSLSSAKAQRCFWGRENPLSRCECRRRVKRLCACTNLAQRISITKVQTSAKERVPRWLCGCSTDCGCCGNSGHCICCRSHTTPTSLATPTTTTTLTQKGGPKKP